MEEIITVDGRQFKLTVDRPLTATERAQTLAEIRKQTGCGTCGGQTAQARSMDPNWGYGGTVNNRSMQSMSVPGIGPGITCPTGKVSGNTVTFTANPSGGIGPYTVRFWYAPMGDVATLTPVAAAHVNIPEGTPSSDPHVLLDADINAALGNAAAPAPVDVDLGTFAPVLTGAATALLAGSIRLYSCAVDSCTGVAKPGTCVQWCDLAITCAAPTCNFVVT